MYKCIITEHFGPFCGQGGYGSITQTGMDRSPKKAVWKARHWSVADGKATRTYHNPTECGAGGGVPILRRFQMMHNNKVIMDVYE